MQRGGGNTSSQTQWLTRIWGPEVSQTTRPKQLEALLWLWKEEKLKHYPSTSCVKWVHLFLLYMPPFFLSNKAWFESVYVVSWNKPHCFWTWPCAEVWGTVLYVSIQINPRDNTYFFLSMLQALLCTGEDVLSQPSWEKVLCIPTIIGFVWFFSCNLENDTLNDTKLYSCITLRLCSYSTINGWKLTGSALGCTRSSAYILWPPA